MEIQFYNPEQHPNVTPDFLADQIAQSTFNDSSLLTRTPDEISRHFKHWAIALNAETQEMVGIGALHPLPLPRGRNLRPKWEEFGSLWVNPNIRNCGIGKQLVLHMLKMDNNKHNLLATTTNPAMVRIFTKDEIGFTETPYLNLSILVQLGMYLERFGGLDKSRIRKATVNRLYMYHDLFTGKTPAYTVLVRERKRE